MIFNLITRESYLMLNAHYPGVRTIYHLERAFEQERRQKKKNYSAKDILKQLDKCADDLTFTI